VSNSDWGNSEKHLAKVELRPELESSFANLLLNHLDTAAFCLNAEAQFMLVNLAFCELIGISAQELYKVLLYELEENSSLHHWQEQWQSVKQQRSLTRPARYRLKSCSLPVTVSMRYIEHQGQELICASVTIIPKPKTQIDDSTSLISSEQTKHLSEIKTLFISSICHQFRALLNIVSFSNSLLKRNLSQWSVDETKPYLDHIQTAVEQITQLLDKSLLFGKLTTGHLQPELTPIDLTEFCQQVIAEMQPMLNASQQKSMFTSSKECWISTDSRFLKIILTNLLSNASKYSSPNSTIYFTVVCEPQSVTFQIQDSGIGITEIDQQRLFEPFYRGSNVGDLPGSGLGLATVKKLVELQGGEVNLTSTIDFGTTVVVMLPMMLAVPSHSE
jgi:two-component system, OmpR family, phosphate regulon sensor histidine kinase PhoR